MVACASCGTENPAGSRFCNACGSALADPVSVLPEERKTVTALFCDLVGFTATSEGADPEDVDRMLTAYFDMARRQVEAHGGVVEKFIGDAILGVFGVPAAHEDDPERAVRAALRVCEDAADLRTLDGTPLRLRAGINTGEVLVRLGVAPGSGERFLAGDTINTASRIQSVAPEMGVAVGLATYEATKAVFDYEELPPATLKGKAEPVRVFHPTASRARLGTDITRTHRGPFVGREIDLALLRSLFDKSVAADAVGLVTVVGEPGMGKSRIVAELAAYADAKPELVTWRQGRCLPYGEGITFWALGEIVKAHAGILESDPAAVAAAKLEAVLPDGDERPWFRQRLLPLLGIEATSQAAQEELFTAWRRFIEHLAEQRPTVLVFEDLHWADPGLIAFLEHLADRAQGVPLLVVGTARPELFEHHPLFAGNRVNLAPLSTAETSRLVAGLLGGAVPPELAAPILDRAEGNPLYAEEFVRLLRDRDLLEEAGGAVSLRPGATVPLPESIGALLAARLDTLPAERKAMLADAAVVGKVFWAGAVAAMGGRDADTVAEALRELGRRELVRPARRSSIEGEAEYAFWHVLARDVAYGSIPRAARAARHVAAARWIEARAGGRVEDIAEVLAQHYATAVELVQGGGHIEQADGLEASAVRYLTLAGEKAMRLDVANAVALFRRAVLLGRDGVPGRGRLLRFLGEAEFTAGQVSEGVALLESAIEACAAAGDAAGADEATMRLIPFLNSSGDRPRSESLLDALIVRLEASEPSETLARAYIGKQFFDQNDRSWTDRALALAQQLDLATVHATALAMRGLARSNPASPGDPAGFDDLRASLALALQQQTTVLAVSAYANLAFVLAADDLVAAMAIADEGIAFERSRGIAISRTRVELLWVLLPLGEWDRILGDGAEIIGLAEPLGDRWGVGFAAGPMTVVMVRRGDVEGAMALAAASGGSLPAEYLLLAPIVGHRTRGDREEAARLLEATVTARLPIPLAINYDRCDIAREAVALGRLDLLERLRGAPTGAMTADGLVRTSWAALAAEAGARHMEALDWFRIAAGGWHAFGDPYEEAHSLLGQGRCLVVLGRPGDAAPPLHEARAIFERLGAALALAETNALLDAVL